MNSQILVFLLCLFTMFNINVEAMAVGSSSGYSSFSASVDPTAKTITITSTINSPHATYVITETDTVCDPECDIGVWNITNTVTNGTTESWTKLDTEIKPWCDKDEGAGSTACPTIDGAYLSSTDTDFFDFDQGNPRTLDSSAFLTTTSLEAGLADVVRFEDGTLNPNGITTSRYPFDSEGFTFDSAGSQGVQILERPVTPSPTCYDMASTTYSFTNINVTGTSASNLDILRPGFAFELYDREFDGFVIGRKRTIGPTDACDAATNLDLTTTQVCSGTSDDPQLPVLWDSPNDTVMRYQTDGTIPTRQFVVQWGNGNVGVRTVQMIFYEENDWIDYIFSETSSSDATSTSGIRDVNGHTDCTTAPSPSPCEFLCTVDGTPSGCDRVDQWSFNSAIGDQTAVRFTRTSCGADWGWTHRP